MAKLTIVDDENNVIGSAERKKIRAEGLNWRFSAILIFNKKGEMLIGRRPETIRRFPNLWTFPAGGKVDAGESYTITAHRELKEELGVEMDLKECFDYASPSSSANCIIFVQVFEGEKESGFKPEPSEVAELKWISKANLKKDIINNPQIYTTPFIKGMSIFFQ